MTPKEKAQELINKFQSFADTYHYGNLANAKQCALIAVNEIIKSIPMSPTYEYNDGKVKYTLNSENYWEQVKTEIEQL